MQNHTQERPPFITIEGIKITFDITTGKIKFNLDASITGKEFTAWRERNKLEILEAIKKIAPAIYYTLVEKRKKSKGRKAIPAKGIIKTQPPR